VVSPADIPTTNKERVQKEDRRDSVKIARALRAGELTPIFVPCEKTLEDRALIRMRITLTRDLARYKNRIKSFLYFHGIDYPKEFEKSGSHWSKRFMAWLDSIEMREQSGRQSLRALTGEYMNLRKGLLVVVLQIRALSRTEPYSELAKLLQRLPGIGLITAMAFLTELETVSRFRDRDHLCGLVGLVPSTHSSGEKERTGDITPRAHNILRTALIESAWVAIRVDPVLKKYFYGYCQRMTPNRAIIRIAKRLLGMIHFVLKNKRPYVSLGC
jgi:transposase